MRLTVHSIPAQSGSRGGVDRFSMMPLPTPLRGVDVAINLQRLSHDLIHVVIAIAREPPDEVHLGTGRGERGIASVERGVLGARDWIVRIAFALRIFVDDARLFVVLPGQV